MGRANEDVNNFDILREDRTHTDLACGGVGIVYSQTYICPKDVTFGFEWKFTSAGVILASIAIEQGSTAPTVEGTADTNFVVVENTGNLITNTADALVHIKAYAPTVCNFLRVRVTTAGANDASTVLERFLVHTIVNA